MIVRAAIVDTNVLVSAVLTRDESAPTARILQGMLAGTFPFVLSAGLLDEYREVLLRPAIQQRHGLQEEEIDVLLGAIVGMAMIREPPVSAAAPNAKDQHVWDLVAGVPNTVLVTGDRRLREKAQEGASVVSPATFLGLTQPGAP